MINPLDIIRKYYMLDSLAGQSLLIHSQLVRDKAQSLAIRHPEMDLDIPFIQEAAMLHDIGIFLTVPICYARKVFRTMPLYANDIPGLVYHSK